VLAGSLGHGPATNQLTDAAEAGSASSQFLLLARSASRERSKDTRAV